MKSLFVLSCAFAGGLAAFGFTFSVERGIRYSDAADRCVLDVKWPKDATNFATVVNFHGGGLVGGNRHFARWPQEAADRDPVAFVAAGYRLLHDKKTGSRATPEECISDAAAAVAWTLDNISRYGGDPKKVFVTGISGGGYLTAMVGLDPKWLSMYGHVPADIAGIAPFTGQMTKHFNVRKIGFSDASPQFQPMIDAWAPLAHAGGTNLPPACFLTGGRDVEWKCRVEENELLAASMRSCGYPNTEFHETEGDHGGGVRPSAYFLRDFVMKTCDAGGVGRFADGERVVFHGDSITHGGMFICYLQLFQNLRHPGSNVRLINGGGIRRFERDFLPFKADRTFLMFGMNDAFRSNMATLADKLAAAHVKTVLVTPTPFDQHSVFEKADMPFCNDPDLAACAAHVRALATAQNLGLVDLHAPLAKLFRDHAKDFRFCADRAHPGNEGHLIIAAHVLDAMHVSPFVARVQIDAAAGVVAPVGRGPTMNVAVSSLRACTNGVAFTYAPKALPFPKLPEYETAETFYPLTERLNQEVIAVVNLAPGAYDLAFDSAHVGTFTAEALAAGVNVALLETPNQRRAQTLASPMRRLQTNLMRVRTDGQRAGRDILSSLQDEDEDLYEQMGAVRPAVSRVVIRPTTADITATRPTGRP